VSRGGGDWLRPSTAMSQLADHKGSLVSVSIAEKGHRILHYFHISLYVIQVFLEQSSPLQNTGEEET
jgi:hypothetical protein